MKMQELSARPGDANRWGRTLLYASALTCLLLPLATPTGAAGTKRSVFWQPYACGLDSVTSFVNFRGIALSTVETVLPSDPEAGAIVKISPAAKISSLSFGVLGYTNLNITLIGDNGEAHASVANGSLKHFVAYQLTPKDFTGNTGNVTSMKIQVINNSNFGSAPTYIQKLVVNGVGAYPILKSAGCH